MGDRPLDGRLGWSPHEPPLSLALSLARMKPACSRSAKSASAMDLGARSGTETRQILNASFMAISVECQPDEYVRLHEMFRLTERVTLLNMCATNGRGPKVSILYNADGATTLVRQALSHTGERKRHNAAARKMTPVISMPLDHLLWKTPLPPEEPGHSLSLPPSDTYVQALQQGGGLPHPVCAIKVDVQGHELAALEGLRLTLARYHPVVYFEWDHRFQPKETIGEIQPRSIRNFLRGFGYSCVPNDNVTVPRMGQWPCALGYCDITCSADTSEANLLRWVKGHWPNAYGRKPGSPRGHNPFVRSTALPTHLTDESGTGTGTGDGAIRELVHQAREGVTLEGSAPPAPSNVTST